VRQAALGVQRAVDRVDDDAARPARAEAPLAELLGDEQEVLAGLLQPPDDRRLGRGVDRRRVVAALAFPDHRLARFPSLEIREHRANVVGRRAARLEPVLHRRRP
jgi:hypothetical protein